MPDPLSARTELASDLARRAGALALDYFSNRGSLKIETKTGDLDMVSIADRAVEDMIRSEISEAFSDDAILGEEGGATPGGSGLTWVIDPIDGTVPFLSGLPHWCVVLAVVQGSQTQVGVIDVPVAGEHFAARRAQGVTLNGERLRLDPGKRLGQGFIGVGASDRHSPAPIAGVLRRLLEAGGMYYRNGSGANMLASVAAGRLAGYVEPAMNPWDSLAGLLMIREAGGLTHPFPPGASLGLVLGAAPGVWDDLRAIVAAEFPDEFPGPDK